MSINCHHNECRNRYECMYYWEHACTDVYDVAYAYGRVPPHYPVPALASTDMVVLLSWYERLEIAWDDIWRWPLWINDAGLFKYGPHYY